MNCVKQKLEMQTKRTPIFSRGVAWRTSVEGICTRFYRRKIDAAKRHANARAWDLASWLRLKMSQDDAVDGSDITNWGWVDYPIIYRVLAPSQVVVWYSWTINSIMFFLFLREAHGSSTKHLCYWLAVWCQVFIKFKELAKCFVFKLITPWVSWMNHHEATQVAPMYFDWFWFAVWMSFA